MIAIDQKEIKNQLNNCYDAWDPNWQYNIGNANLVRAFKYYLEQEAGLKLDFEVEIKGTQAGYKINQIEVVEPETFMLWKLRWS